MGGLWKLLISTVIFILKSNSLSQPISATEKPVFMCDSEIYCQGPILEAVNRLHIFQDSKHYVDMPLKQSETETLKNFKNQFPDTSKISADALKQFLTDHFYEPRGEHSYCVPDDWVSNPSTFSAIKDDKYRQWALDLHQIWLKLCRRMNETVDENCDRTSALYVPNNFIVPGGRFREYYYWDTYWIVKGLLMSQMYNTTRDIISNFGYLVDYHGFIPNGGRIYYMQRSQPPFFIPMVYEYYIETEDTEFLKVMLPHMARELRFWDEHRTISVKVGNNDYTVYRHYTITNTPRPEMFREDTMLADKLKDKSLKPKLFRDIAAGAESGMDFGSRYFGDQKNLVSIRTTEILPVDLNAILCWNHFIMHFFYNKIGKKAEADKHYKRRQEIIEMVEAVFYNDTAGTWFDRDLKTGQHRQHFYPSNAVPLFTTCYDPLDKSVPHKVYAYMNKTGALSFPNGIPSSLIETDPQQQWDLPNGWAPQNHMIIEGFRKSGTPKMQELAFEIAKAWLKVNYLVFKKTGHMYEKYNVSDTTYVPGGGGEYDVQTGFGWTNGVVLDLLKTYGPRLVAPEEEVSTDASTGKPTASTGPVYAAPTSASSSNWRAVPSVFKRQLVQTLLTFAIASTITCSFA